MLEQLLKDGIITQEQINVVLRMKNFGEVDSEIEGLINLGFIDKEIIDIYDFILNKKDKKFTKKTGHTLKKALRLITRNTEKCADTLNNFAFSMQQRG